ncbi:MAG TPA: hypothetical protein PLC34_10295 [Burkholderiaceae bacterium]|nr:hypothetical protein [Burkholderiaceae bacterium]
MRVLLSVLSLLVVVAVVGFLASKQVKSVSENQVPVLPAPTDTATPAVSATGNVQQQSQAIQQQFKAAAEAAVHQARPVPDDK